MRVLLILAAVVLFTACEPWVERWVIDSYIQQCKDHGGIQHISNFSSVATCIDGKVVNPRRA